MKQIRTPLNYNHEQEKYSESSKPSMTVPDQTMSMREMLSRYAKGLPIGGAKESIYDENEESWGINPKTLDLVDIQEIKRDNKERIENLQKVIENSKKKKQQEPEVTIIPEGH